MDSHQMRHGLYNSNIDYLPYTTNPSLQASVMAMEADRLTAAMIQAPQSSHTYSDTLNNPPATAYNPISSPETASQHSSNSQYTVPVTPTNCNMQGYATVQSNTLFKNTTDINSNPLLSFREMTYPLLNQ